MLLNALYERLCMAPLNRLPCYGALEVIVQFICLTGFVSCSRLLKFVKVHIIIGQIIGPAAAGSAGPVPTPIQPG